VLDAVDKAAAILAAEAAVLFVVERDAILGALIAHEDERHHVERRKPGPLSPPVIIQSGWASPISIRPKKGFSRHAMPRGRHPCQFGIIRSQTS